tara:strand:+ start:355 stop:507 length:153 start_codon:yes stop_codon:yes gene_type:complete
MKSKRAASISIHSRNLIIAGFETFSGVDVFLVISGDLITSIILTQKEAGR